MVRPILRKEFVLKFDKDYIKERQIVSPVPKYVMFNKKKSNVSHKFETRQIIHMGESNRRNPHGVKP